MKAIIQTPHRFIWTWLLLLMAGTASATHYRAGEILYEQIGPRTYRITAFSYTDPGSRADANTINLTIDFGDKSDPQTVNRSGRRTLSSRVVQNTYQVVHEYKADGNYIVSFYDQNRVDGIVNINNGRTELIAFYVETQIRINNQLGINRSPVLTKPPIDNGCKGIPYYHNPSAYDPDGDSLVFRLIEPRDRSGVPVPLYSDPEADNSFGIGLNDGQLYWDSPKREGTYNIAIEIREYRLGILIGYLVRDMQIFIATCFNNPPLIQDVADGCVVQGDSITRMITASDPDVSPVQNVSLTGLGGAFATQNLATINPDPAIGVQTVSTMFKWTPSCNQIRYMPWQIIFEARDNGNAVSQNDFRVKVVGPAVSNLRTRQVGNGFDITWNRDTCNLATYYEVYRRLDSSHWNPTYCEPGIPSYTGFVKIANIKVTGNPDPTLYHDDNNGAGLSPLITYCYRVVACYSARGANGEILYADSSFSMASMEVCDNIILSAPSLTMVSVTSTSAVNGKIDLSYIRPDTLDSITYEPPYRFILKRSEASVEAYSTVKTDDYNSFAAVPVMNATDSQLNTLGSQYKYKVELWAMMNGTNTLVATSLPASSVYAGIYSTDRTNILSWNYQVPWHNDTFIIYRQNSSGVFEALDTTTQHSYHDRGLTNGTEYCYRILTSGYYRAASAMRQTLNYSQHICGSPIDTVSPCPPALLVFSPCDQNDLYENKLVWDNQGAPCASDVMKYRVYYKQLSTDTYTLIAEVPANVFTYTDNRNVLKESITGCYYVSGVDSVGNESPKENERCIENCPRYELPNVFSPNGDGVNDLFIPFPYRFVSKIDMVIFNRWGLPVFQTINKDVLWDGKDQQTKKDLPEGVYFYTCVVYEIYLDGVRERKLTGTVQIIRK